MGLFGFGPHSGSSCKWRYIGHELGKVEQKQADVVQLRNLQIEIEATRARKSAIEQLSEERCTAMAEKAGSEYANITKSAEITATNTEGCMQSPMTQPQKVSPNSEITEDDGSNVQGELFSTPETEVISVVPEDSSIGDGKEPLTTSPMLPLAKGTEAMFLPGTNQSNLSPTLHKMLPTIFTGPVKHINNVADKQNLPEEALLQLLITPNILHVDAFSNITPNIPAKQLAAIEQLYHDIVNQYCVPHHESTGMMYCQLASPVDTSTDQNTNSAGNNLHSALQGDAHLNFLICDNSGNTKSVTFDIETNGHGQQEVLAMVGKYLEPLTVCFDMGWQRRLSGTSYNSMSGHAFLVSANSNKILRRVVYSKSCCTCM